MNRQYIEDNHIVDRYLLGQLSEDEVNAFEAYYIEHPEMLEELTIAKSMHKTVKEESSNLLAVSQTEELKTSWLERVFPPKLGFALCSILAVAVISLWFQNSRLKTVDAYVVSAPSIVFSQTRGAPSELETLSISSDQATITIQILNGPIGYPEVSLQLKNSKGELIWQGDAELTDPVGSINIVLDTRSMHSDEYAISVFPPQNTLEALSVHSFIVKRL